MAEKTAKDNVVLSVSHVSKNFALPHEKNTSIKSSIVNIFKKKDRSVEVQHALKDISFDIKEGEFFGILGRNGSGKSTMLKVLAEIYQPTKGKVHTKGKLVPFIELGVGFNPELTGRENVYLNGALLGFSRKEIDERYDDIVAFAELEEFMDQKLKNYSSGMQVRLAFSVATRAEADILLVDEVLAVGDAEFQRKCFQYFKSLKKNNKTVIFVTHDMSAVREYCDKAILIEEGVIAHQGKANAVANEYLKMFNKASGNDARGKDMKSPDRWGNETAVVESITSRVTEKGVDLNFAVRNNKVQEDDLVIGFRIRNSKGDIITGANSQRTHAIVKKGAVKSFIFHLDNIFSNDSFVVDVTLRQRDGITICDNWDNAATFSVTRDENFPYSIVPPVKVEVV